MGDRVQLIPFKHKGKHATVKYFGAIGRKFGTWVGLELDVSSTFLSFKQILTCFDCFYRNRLVRTVEMSMVSNFSSASPCMDLSSGTPRSRSLPTTLSRLDLALQQ